MQEYNLIATCASGLEALVGDELRHLGYDVQVENGRARFKGTIADIFWANMWLRTADRIKIVLSEFEAKAFDDLFEETKKIPWDQYLPMDAEFPVNGRSQKSILHHVPSIQSIVKKAVVKQMSDVYHRHTKFPETGAKFGIEAVINKNHVMLLLDTTGSSLFKRGYRVEKGAAPLKENMAAALVLLAHWYPDMPFVDPVCGSGTIPIEAALIAKNVAPGSWRTFACESWPLFPDDLAQQLREKAKQLAKPEQEVKIFGYDISGEMVDIARLNAQNAGVLYDITFKQLAVKDFKTADKNGVIVANPPYGVRLSDREAAEELYGQMGHIYQQMGTWSKYILSSDLNFEKAYGQKATKRRKLYNGALRTDLFQYWGKKER
ncbi:RNA methyltransferase [Ligilactobacillus salitolerans]|uniref:RNA methyltransferase n=1 Tax=Ligilactobacillus salitolerans TaxID=1808352 RepID=A0A401IWC2_9LACO|nr:class I SAM-dependent RNA methyltransferase [Ligilactobacillus salitolerans]GBG95809.1 RNA methyltransferase [Ligilactobacillus salitolerans]